MSGRCRSSLGIGWASAGRSRCPAIPGKLLAVNLNNCLRHCVTLQVRRLLSMCSAPTNLGLGQGAQLTVSAVGPAPVAQAAANLPAVTDDQTFIVTQEAANGGTQCEASNGTTRSVACSDPRPCTNCSAGSLPPAVQDGTWECANGTAHGGKCLGQCDSGFLVNGTLEAECFDGGSTLLETVSQVSRA